MAKLMIVEITIMPATPAVSDAPIGC